MAASASPRTHLIYPSQGFHFDKTCDLWMPSRGDDGIPFAGLCLWNTSTLEWERATAADFGGEGGAGGDVTVTNFPASYPVTGTFWQSTQPVSMVSAPLPDGAATEATLAAIAGEDFATQTTLASLNGKVTACNTGAVVISSSALPSGAATATRQDTGNTSLANIDGKLPALSGGRVPVVLPAGGGGLTDGELRATPVEVKLRTDDPTYYIYVPPMALAANKIFLAIRNTGAVPIKVRKLFLVNAALTAVTGVGVQWDVDDISGITGGTAITPRPSDSADGALANFTCVHSPTSVTKDFTWFSWYTNNDEIGLTGGFPQATIQALGNILAEGAKMKDITLNQNEGTSFKQITSTVVGSCGVLCVVTVGA